MEKVWTPLKINVDTSALKLGGVAAGSALIYLLAFILPANLLKLYTRTGLDGHLLSDVGIPAYARIIVAFLCLGLLYWLGFRLTRRSGSKIAWVIVLCSTLIFNTELLFMAPFDALDIYDNISHGRIVGVYAANPFRQLIADFPQDPFFKYPRWKDVPSAYGPVWEMLAGLTARLAGNGIVANVLAFKIMPGLFHLASIGIVLIILRRKAPEQALAGALFLGWNPVVLYETWGNGHNDIVMVFWILLAALSINRKWYTLATLSLVIGALIKFLPLLLIPAVLLVGLYSLPTIRTRLAFVAKTAATSFLLVVVAQSPFWNGFASFSIDRRMGMFTTSIPAVIYQLLKPILGLTVSSRLVSLAALGMLAGFIVHGLIHIVRDEASRDFPRTAFTILAFYLMVTCLWFQQWYSLWLIGLAPLLSRSQRRFAVSFGFWVLSKQLIFGPLIVPIMAARPALSIWLEPLLALTVLGVPWFIAWLNLRTPRQMGETYAA